MNFTKEQIAEATRIARGDRAQKTNGQHNVNGHGVGSDLAEGRATFLAAARPLNYYADFATTIKARLDHQGHPGQGGIIPTSSGRPAGGKSALYGSAATYLAAARRENWHGFKIRKQYAGVIFAMERADLVRKNGFGPNASENN